MNSLGSGLEQSIELNYVKKTDIFSTFDVIHCFMSQDLKDQKDAREVKLKTSYLADTFVNSYKFTKNVFQTHTNSKKLWCNNKILIIKWHKGNRVVIVDRTHYMQRFLMIRQNLKTKVFSLKMLMIMHILLSIIQPGHKVIL